MSIESQIPRASTSMTPPGPGRQPYVPSRRRERARREARPLPRDFGRSQIMAAAGRESWHGDLGKKIEAAWTKVVLTLRDAEDACTLYLSADADAAAHDAEYEAKVAAWVEAGEKGSRPARQTMDWPAIKAERLAVARRAIERGIETATAYRATVTGHAAEDVDRLVAKSLTARKKAAEAIAVASEQVRTAVTAAKAVRAADSSLKITAGPGWWRSSAVRSGGLEDKALAAARNLEAWISSDDPVLTGEHVRDMSPVLPKTTREWIVEYGSEHHMTVLAAVEVIEDRSVSDLAGDFAGVLNHDFIAEVRRGMEHKDLAGIL